jgi:hypothetical protein
VDYVGNEMCATDKSTDDAEAGQSRGIFSKGARVFASGGSLFVFRGIWV